MLKRVEISQLVHSKTLLHSLLSFSSHPKSAGNRSVDTHIAPHSFQYCRKPLAGTHRTFYRRKVKENPTLLLELWVEENLILLLEQSWVLKAQSFLRCQLTRYEPWLLVFNTCYVCYFRIGNSSDLWMTFYYSILHDFFLPQFLAKWRIMSCSMCMYVCHISNLGWVKCWFENTVLPLALYVKPEDFVVPVFCFLEIHIDCLAHRRQSCGLLNQFMTLWSCL